MNKFIIVIILFLIAFDGLGQKIRVNANIGYGTYFLKDLKNLQSDMISSTVVNDKSVENFPNYIYYTFSIDYSINPRHYLGLDMSRYSTGGRNHVADYSGEYSFDMIASAYAFMVNYKMKLTSFNKFDLFFQFKTGILFSKLEISERLDVYNHNSIITNYQYKGYSLALEPGLYLTYSIYKSISINLSTGFETADQNTRLLNKNESDEELISFMDNTRADWSGLRISIGISYTIGKKTKKNVRAQHLTYD